MVAEGETWPAADVSEGRNYGQNSLTIQFEKLNISKFISVKSIKFILIEVFTFRNIIVVI